MKSLRLLPPLVAAFATLSSAHAAVIRYTDLAAFDAAAGSPSIAIDFDGIAPGTDLAGTTLRGVTFSSPDGNSLDVVVGADTFTDGSKFTGTPDPDGNRLLPTSGANVLSPGGLELVPGPDPAEKDSLQLDFATPLAAFGLDILYQSADGVPLTLFAVFDSTLVVTLTAGTPIGNLGGGGAPGSASFLGFVSDDPATHISRVLITESDGNATFPDSNIGYDSFRFAVAEPPGEVPEPGVLGLLGSGLLAAGLLRRRRRDRR